MMLVIGVYGRIDWTIARLARARHPFLSAGDAYLQFMEEREDADLGALASSTSRHEVKRRKMRDTLSGEVCWVLAFHRPFKTPKRQPLDLLVFSREVAAEATVRVEMLPAVDLRQEVYCEPDGLNTTEGRNQAAAQLRAARRALAARVAKAHR